VTHGLLECAQGRCLIHACAQQKVVRRREDVVDERVGGQVPCQVFMLSEQRCGASCGFEGEPAYFLGTLGCLEISGQGLNRPSQVAQCYTKRTAGQTSYMADDQIYLVSCTGVEVEVPDGSPPRRSNSCSFAAGAERFFEAVHPHVDLSSFHERILNPLEVTVFQGGNRLFEYGDRLVKDRVRSHPDHALGIDREECVDDQCGAAADQRFEEALGREASPQGLESDHQDHGGDGSFVYTEISSTEEYGCRHRQSYHDPGLCRSDTDHGHEKVCDRNSKSHT